MTTTPLPYHAGTLFQARQRADLLHRRRPRVRAGSLGGQVTRLLYPAATLARDASGRFAPWPTAPSMATPTRPARRRGGKSTEQEAGPAGRATEGQRPTLGTTRQRRSPRAGGQPPLPP